MAGLISGVELETVRAGRERVLAEIAEAARKAGRDPGEVELLAAVKYIPLEDLGTLAEAGLTIVGENRAQELEAKAEAHPDFRWHFIGQLQSRKVKQILPLRRAHPLRRLRLRAAPAREARHARDARCSSRSTSRATRARPASRPPSSPPSSRARRCACRG